MDGAKLILFRKILSKKSTIISNDKIPIFKILNQIAKKKNLRILNIKKIFKKINNIDLKLNEDFKIRNLAMAIEAAKLCGLKEKHIIGVIKKIKDVDGRLELVRKYPNNVKVFIDYAHTPDALLKTLQTLEKIYGKNIT